MPKKRNTAAKKSPSTEALENIETPLPASKSEVPSPVKTRKKVTKSPARKTSLAGKAPTGKRAGATRRSEPSADQIELRAYFISEHRHRHGVPGDHHSDWLEARRQLLLEAGQK